MSAQPGLIYLIRFGLTKQVLQHDLSFATNKPIAKRIG